MQLIVIRQEDPTISDSLCELIVHSSAIVVPLRAIPGLRVTVNTNDRNVSGHEIVDTIENGCANTDSVNTNLDSPEFDCQLTNLTGKLRAIQALVTSVNTDVSTLVRYDH